MKDNKIGQAYPSMTSSSPAAYIASGGQPIFLGHERNRLLAAPEPATELTATSTAAP